MAEKKERVRAPHALAAIDRLRGTVAGLPEVTEAIDGFGHVSFRVRDKPFVIVGNGAEGEGSLAIKADRAAQRFLIEHRGYVRTPYIGQHGWVSVARLPPDSWPEIDDLVVDGYRLAAPASLVKRMGETGE